MIDRWIPVTERMPEDDYTPGDKRVQIKVLVCNIHNGQKSVRTLVRQYSSCCWRLVDGKREVRLRWEWSKNVHDSEITHWMPLPKLPDSPECVKMDGGSE